MPQRTVVRVMLQIFQAAFDETDDFVFCGFGLNEIWILFVEIQERFLERGQLE